MKKPDWTIPLDAANWECGWEDSARFHLRYFKALPMIDKLRAVEEMCDLADLLDAQRRPRPDGVGF